LRLRAGSGAHRFIGIWVVVVKGRVFVRSWSVKPNGWYRTFLKEPRGTIQVANYEIAVRTVADMLFAPSLSREGAFFLAQETKKAPDSPIRIMFYAGRK
jgi:hypothetical protein